jgi:hypothetical protein
MKLFAHVHVFIYNTSVLQLSYTANMNTWNLYVGNSWRDYWLQEEIES